MRLSLTLISLTLCAASAHAQDRAASYTGSAACQTCHAQIYSRWSKTRMANVVRDPKTHPDAIIPDLSKADPAIVKFKRGDIAFVYGSKWKQRFFTKTGDDYFPLDAQWDIAHQKWLPYHVKPGTDLYLLRVTSPECSMSPRPSENRLGRAV